LFSNHLSFSFVLQQHPKAHPMPRTLCAKHCADAGRGSLCSLELSGKRSRS